MFDVTGHLMFFDDHDSGAWDRYTDTAKVPRCLFARLFQIFIRVVRPVFNLGFLSGCHRHFRFGGLLTLVTENEVNLPCDALVFHLRTTIMTFNR